MPLSVKLTTKSKTNNPNMLHNITLLAFQLTLLFSVAFLAVDTFYVHREMKKDSNTEVLPKLPKLFVFDKFDKIRKNPQKNLEQ